MHTSVVTAKLELQAERAARERAEEDKFRRQTMERFAEQDRVEQMNAQKRRIKVAEHAREVERLIQEKKQMYEAAMVSTLPPNSCFLGDQHIIHNGTINDIARVSREIKSQEVAYC